MQQALKPRPTFDAEDVYIPVPMVVTNDGETDLLAPIAVQSLSCIKTWTYLYNFLTFFVFLLVRIPLLMVVTHDGETALLPPILVHSKSTTWSSMTAKKLSSHLYRPGVLRCI
jgi:hypothetical protein